MRIWLIMLLAILSLSACMIRPTIKNNPLPTKNAPLHQDTLTIDSNEYSLGENIIACVNKTLIGNFQLTSPEHYDSTLVVSATQQQTPGCFNLNNLTWDLGFSSNNEDHNISFTRVIERITPENQSDVGLTLTFFGSKNKSGEGLQETNPAWLIITNKKN